MEAAGGEGEFQLVCVQMGWPRREGTRRGGTGRTLEWLPELAGSVGSVTTAVQPQVLMLSSLSVRGRRTHGCRCRGSWRGLDAMGAGGVFPDCFRFFMEREVRSLAKSEDEGKLTW